MESSPEENRHIGRRDPRHRKSSENDTCGWRVRHLILWHVIRSGERSVGHCLLVQHLLVFVKNFVFDIPILEDALPVPIQTRHDPGQTKKKHTDNIKQPSPTPCNTLLAHEIWRIQRMSGATGHHILRRSLPSRYIYSRCLSCVVQKAAAAAGSAD